MNQVRSALPNHIVIIPDGNRRWAKEHGLPKFEGHRRGFDTGIKIARYLRELKIHTFTMWAFSTENWKRTKDEVGYLMRLYSEMTDKLLGEAVRDNVRMVHLGREDRLPDFLLKKVKNAEEKTKKNKAYVLNIALDYGGRDEVIRAINRMIDERRTNNQLTEMDFENFLDTAGQPYPNPDLIIRTSGEMRTSGFMPWQAAYAEYIFLEKHFPDLTEKDIDLAIEEYARRQRRFGK